jgi:CHAT domain-containing protein
MTHALHGRRAVRNRVPVAICLTMSLCVAAMSGGSAQAQVGQSIPSVSYFNHFALLYAGEYRDALKGFGSERGIRTPQSRWIDSICYYTMTGECYYKLGQYREALDSYTAALNLYVAFSNWMTSVRFPPAIAPVSNRRPLPWGRSTRNMALGKFPQMPIAQGRPVTEADIRRGGVISTPIERVINVTEIIRCTCLAMMRRGELLGPLSKHDALTAKVEAAAQQRQGVPNHWSRAWLDAQLGFAAAAAGNTGQAVGFLQQSLAINGEMDHPITGLALLQLGKISLDAGRLPEAARLFEEASYTAAEHGDQMVLEEAFRYGAITHAIARSNQVFAPLAPAAAWAKQNAGRELHVSLVILAAESAAQIGEAEQAQQLLLTAKNLIGRRIMLACEIGARLNFVGALVQYQNGKVAAGDDALAAALKIYKGFSPWLFQLAVTSTELAKNNLSGRDARTIFERLGDDPTPADWVARPLDCLAVLTTPHHATYEQWFATLPERDLETRLEVSERARRHRFYTALPFGGRLLALRWLFEAPEASLDNAARLQRQDLETRFPSYVELRKRAEAARAELNRLPLSPAALSAEDTRKQAELYKQLADATSGQETVLREIAVRREPANFVFPPLRKMKDVQDALPEGTVLLNVFAANRQLHALLLSKDKYAGWKVERPDVLEKKIAAMLRAMGNFDGNREVQTSQFDPAWREAAREVNDHFLKGSGINFAQKFDELIVVPDGPLWYLPFEALHVGQNKDTIPLIAKTRVRYAPTVGLAFTERPGRIESPEIAVVMPKDDPRDASDDAATFVSRLQSSLPQATLLQGAPHAPSPFYGSLVDGLVVLEDLGNTPQASLAWSPLPIDGQKGAGSLLNWLALPWKTTDVVVLTGFHTPSENSLRDGSLHGYDMFLASCGLMATGARTVLLSRWRTGGQSSRELVRQFLQELPFTSAAESWQRAVQLAQEAPLDAAYEPRIRSTPGTPAIDGGNPFFWSGYMVLDSGVLPHPKEAEPAEPAVLQVQPAAAAAQKEPAAKRADSEPMVDGGKEV